MQKIKIDNLSYRYKDNGRDTFTLSDISLDVEQGEFICILGPSGCGKSTLLRLMEGLAKPTAGSISIDGKTIAGPGKDRAVVFQQYSLFPWLTVQKNVMFGIEQRAVKLPKKERRSTAARYLEQVGLESAADKYPAQLSGGMRQRVAIARALAMDAEVLLMDEPFGAVDPRLRVELQELISRLSQEHGKTVIFVTHDIDEALLLANRIIVMEPGRIRADIPVTLPRPRRREALIVTPEYQTLSRRLMSLFYERVANQIGNEEVAI